MKLPDTFSTECLGKVAGKLAARNHGRTTGATLEVDWASHVESTSSSKNVIVVDQTNKEAISTAHIIKDLLTELLASRALLIPSVLNAGEDLPNCAEKVLVVRSNHCFQMHHFCHSLLRADYLIKKNHHHHHHHHHWRRPG